MTQPAEPQPPSGQEPQAGQQQPAPPWGDAANFDPEKAWSLITNLRDEVKSLKGRPVLDETAKAKLDEFDKLKAASQTDLEKAQTEATRWQTEAETWRKASVSSTIEALAAAEFEFPEDAVGALAEKNYLDAGGTIDKKAIKADLDRLLDQRPNWRRSEGGQPQTRTPRPNGAQGTSGTAVSTDPAQQFGALISQAMQRH